MHCKEAGTNRLTRFAGGAGAGGIAGADADADADAGCGLVGGAACPDLPWRDFSAAQAGWEAVDSQRSSISYVALWKVCLGLSLWRRLVVDVDGVDAGSVVGHAGLLVDRARPMNSRNRRTAGLRAGRGQEAAGTAFLGAATGFATGLATGF